MAEHGAIDYTFASRLSLDLYQLSVSRALTLLWHHMTAGLDSVARFDMEAEWEGLDDNDPRYDTPINRDLVQTGAAFNLADANDIIRTEMAVQADPDKGSDLRAGLQKRRVRRRQKIGTA